MSTLPQANTGALKKSVQDLGNPALLARATEISEDRQDIDKALRIASVLQTTLDIRKVLEIFVAEVGRWISLSGATYEFDEIGINHTVGEMDRHSVAYRLAVTDQPLGEITFMRKRKFTIKENKVLEYLLCGLVYPLRNALAYEKAVQASLRDPLTGIYNRAAMDNAIHRELDLARRHGAPLSLIAIDIDYFKHINDTHGHGAGDCVLKSIVESIKQTVRGSDMVFRYGGEEFTVLLSSTTREGALLLAERIRQNVERTELTCHGAKISATVSLGVAWLADSDTPQSLLERADKVLYQAKRDGRNRVRF